MQENSVTSLESYTIYQYEVFLGTLHETTALLVDTCLLLSSLQQILLSYMTVLIFVLGDAPQVISMLPGSNHVRKPEDAVNKLINIVRLAPANA